MTTTCAPPGPAERAKAATGIAGFDELTQGGLPRGRTTLLLGGPGSGKTIFAMQFLVSGAQQFGEPGIFVAFEETQARILSNLGGFTWNLGAIETDKLLLVDAQPDANLVQSGSFDLDGMFAVLASVVEQMGARRIVFDALDVVLDLLDGEKACRREIYRLHEWLLAKELTALITAKADRSGSDGLGNAQYGFMQFMVDCAVILNHDVALGVSQRNLRVQKYRGSPFNENEAPFVIGKDGFDVAISSTLGNVDAIANDERVGSGVERLDTMLGGGYFRAAVVLITGFPGTAKTTIAGAFAEAACKRGEKTLFVSFDSDSTEVVRNLTSVGIGLGAFAKSGLLRMISARTIAGSAETLLVRIKALAEDHESRCVIIDPVSTLSKSGNELTAHGVTERLIDWSKAAGITLLCTSLLDDLSNPLTAGTPLQISTLADTWIHLNYVLQAGERNRGMSIIKSRGTAHSNQVRELVLSEAGVTLADIYTAGGEVLMGTLRWEKESAERASDELADMAALLRRNQLDAEETELEARLKAMHLELLTKKAEKTMFTLAAERRNRELRRSSTRLRELRSADPAGATPNETLP